MTNEEIKRERNRVRSRIARGVATRDEKRWFELNRGKIGRPKKSAAPSSVGTNWNPKEPSRDGVSSAATADTASPSSSAPLPEDGPPPIDLNEGQAKASTPTEKQPLVVSDSSAMLAGVIVGALRACNEFSRQHDGITLPDSVALSDTVSVSPWGILQAAWGRVIERHFPMDMASEEADLYLAVGSSTAIVGQAGWLYYAKQPAKADPPKPVPTPPPSAPNGKPTEQRAQPSQALAVGGLWKAQ